MSFWRLLGFLGFLGLFTPYTTSAHIGGLPFFKTNGQYSAVYTVPSLSTPDLPVPQDIATGTYVVGEAVTFEIDTKILQVPGSVVKATTFDWDFGDGSNGTGVSNIHSYSKAGPYIISVTSSPSNDPGAKQLIESIIVNILPTRDYKLPQAVMKVNGQAPADPNVAIVTFHINEDTKFSATDSKGGSSPLVSYKWNFGDGSPITTGATVTHQYTADHTFAAPFVRVTDQNEFYSDVGAELQDISDDAAAPAATSTPSTSPLEKGERLQSPPLTKGRLGGVLLYTIIGVLLIGGILVAIGRRTK